MPKGKLSDKQQKFVQEYLVDFNATKAAERSGYSLASAGAIGQRLLKNVEISAAIEAARAHVQAQAEERAVKAELDRQWVIDRLMQNVERSMQAEPVRDREGNATGEYTYQAMAANKGLELLGKTLGMFKDRVEHTGADGGSIQTDVNLHVDADTRRITAVSRLFDRVRARDSGSTDPGESDLATAAGSAD